MFLSLIIPTLNEEDRIPTIINNSKIYNFQQIIVVDGGSEDKTVHYLSRIALKLIHSNASRGGQLLTGAKKSTGKWLLFIHADTKLKNENIMEIKKFICKKENEQKVASFKLKFNCSTSSAKFISHWANIRSSIFKLPFGDQCLLINRKYYFELGGHSVLKIMEDLDFISKVPKNNRVLLKTFVETSFQKYQKRGILLQSIVHFICQILFFLNVHNCLIFKFYKKYGK